jgi:hypothetical protein
VEFLIEIADWSWLAFVALLFLAQLAAHAAGYRLGRHKSIARGGEAEGVGLIVGGILGLLGFVLALTLTYANTRFGEQRHATLEEANAIGTAWLEAEAIDHRRGREIAKLLEEYAKERKQFVEESRRSNNIEVINQRTSVLQSKMWGHLTAISRERSDPIVVSLMQAINNVFDKSTALRFSNDARFPPQMFWLLIGLALISVTTLGFQLGLKGQKTHVLVGTLIAVWTAVIVVILDISSPRIGSIRTSVAAYDWTLGTLKDGILIPP